MKPRHNLWLYPLVVVLVCAAPAGCGNDDDDDGGGEECVPDEPGPDDLALTSAAFEPCGTIPAAYTCENPEVKTGISPPLAWTNPPAGAMAFALTVIDIDANDTPHWGLIDIPAAASSLAEGTSPEGTRPEGAWETLNYRGRLGYAGPCPPPGDAAHRYVFTLWALDQAIGPPTIEEPLADVLPELEAAAIETATLTSVFAR